MMTLEHSNHLGPTAVGAAVTIGSGAYSFFGSTLVVVQWIAAVVAIAVGVATFVHILKHWRTPR